MCFELGPPKLAEQEEIQQQMESYGDLLFQLLDKVEMTIRHFKVCFVHLFSASNLVDLLPFLE